MKLTVFNGSPRGKGSNTKILLDHFTDGFTATEGNTYELDYLVRLKENDDFIKHFREAEQVLLAFPLYFDAMPAIVKSFIESLEPLCGRKGNPDIGFISIWISRVSSLTLCRTLFRKAGNTPGVQI